MDLSADETTWGGLDLADLPRRDLTHLFARRAIGFQAIIHQQVLDHIHWHGSTMTDREVCGILVGDVYQDESGPYLYVEAMIEGTHAAEAAAQVTFTAETWSDMQQIMDQRYPDRRVVGWYHTHPNFGIFLSEMDMFIHSNFFNLPWQVAFVFDPIRRDEGIFLWNDGGTVRGSFLVDQVVPAVISGNPGQITEPNQPKELTVATLPAKWGWGRKLTLAATLMVLAAAGYLAAMPDKLRLVCNWLNNQWPR